MDAKKIENARIKYLNDLFIDFDKTIPLNTQIEKNIYNLNDILSNKAKKNQIPWNDLFCIYIYLIWSPNDKNINKRCYKKSI